jgi:acyl-CoA thioesterase
MPGSQGKDVKAKYSPELGKLQRQGIAAKLANNPVVEFMGIRLIEVAAGKAALMLPHREELHNSMGLLQGGILSVLADVAGGVALYSVLTDPLKVVIPTIEFKMNFLRPASGEDAFARGKVVQSGKQVAVCNVEVATKEEVLLATGLFTYMVKRVTQQAAPRQARGRREGQDRQGEQDKD